jgi:MFS-type transporter involved in bile tolerance (Atg22 family)
MRIQAIYMKGVLPLRVVAVAISRAQRGLKGLNRLRRASPIPPDQAIGLFGFYTMTMKFAHILGPLLLSIASARTVDPK